MQTAQLANVPNVTQPAINAAARRANVADDPHVTNADRDAQRATALAPRSVTRGDAGSPDANLHARLAWLVAADAEAERRSPREEEEALMIRRPITTEQAFARFGFLLGTLPPAAIFLRLFFLLHSAQLVGMIFIPMLLVCALIGRRMGAQAGRSFDADGRGSWARTVEATLENAFVWAAATGATGGAIFFGFGALFGLLCALPIAFVAFVLFASFHRLLARGGMIDARQLAPLAWGINAAIASLILSPFIIPY